MRQHGVAVVAGERLDHLVTGVGPAHEGRRQILGCLHLAHGEPDGVLVLDGGDHSGGIRLLGDVDRGDHGRGSRDHDQEGAAVDADQPLLGPEGAAVGEEVHPPALGLVSRERCGEVVDDDDHVSVGVAVGRGLSLLDSGQVNAGVAGCVHVVLAVAIPYQDTPFRWYIR